MGGRWETLFGIVSGASLFLPIFVVMFAPLRPSSNEKPRRPGVSPPIGSRQSHDC